LKIWSAPSLSQGISLAGGGLASVGEKIAVPARPARDLGIGGPEHSSTLKNEVKVIQMASQSKATLPVRDAGIDREQLAGVGLTQ